MDKEKDREVERERFLVLMSVSSAEGWDDLF